MYVCMYVYIGVCMFVYVYVYVYIDVCMHMNVFFATDLCAEYLFLLFYFRLCSRDLMRTWPTYTNIIRYELGIMLRQSKPSQC